MEESKYIQRSLEIVYNFYRDNLDKSEDPAIIHPLKVGLHFSEESSKLVVCGLLHDILEEKAITEEQLYAEFPDDYVDTIKILTRNSGETYNDYIQSIIDSNNLDAIKIKIVDLSHNLDRNKGKFPSLFERHLSAFIKLKTFINNVKE